MKMWFHNQFSGNNNAKHIMNTKYFLKINNGYWNCNQSKSYASKLEHTQRERERRKVLGVSYYIIKCSYFTEQFFSKYFVDRSIVSSLHKFQCERVKEMMS